MKQFWLVCIVAVSVSLQSLFPVKGEEPYQQFLEALRTNGYHDYALSYLDLLAKKPGVPKELRDGIDFQRANTIIKQAALLTNPDLKTKKLQQAENFIKKFLKEHPSHALAASAQMEQGSISLNRARVANYMLNSPAIEKNLPAQTKLRQQARAHIAQAKIIFKKARVHFEKKTKSYPVYISPDQKERKAASKKATADFISAQFKLGLCLYEEAHTYPVKGKEFKKRLMVAAKAFEEIHSKYRSWAGGLYANMWQAKCYEEQDSSTDIRRALGIYNALLTHPGKSPLLRRLQDEVRRYRFICLNHPSKKDYQLVTEEASRWLSKNRAVTRIALGIRWEKAIAEEMLGKQRDLTENERKKFLQAAREDAEKINRWAGEYKDVSTAMIQRVNIALGQKGKAPKNFDMAISQAETAYSKISELETSWEQEKVKKKKEALEAELNVHLQETARKLRLALSFVDQRTSPKQAYQARAMLGHVLFLLKENFEAAVYAGYVADNARKIDDEIALQAASLASIIWIDAYYAVPKGESNEFEKTMLKKALERIVTHWLHREQGANALMNLGRLYSRMNQPALAAKQYNRIPGKSPAYPDAQMKAGQAYWSAYLKAFQKEKEDRPENKVLEEWKVAAEKYLRSGIAAITKKGTNSKSAQEGLIGGRVSLAQILVHRGKYAEPVILLTKEPHSALKTIGVKNEKDRPQTGIKSKPFARIVHNLLLKCYIQTEQIDKAVRSLKRLETIGGKTDLSTYKRLGKELSDDIDRYRKQGQTAQLKKVLAALEKFLDALTQNNQGQTYGTLIWVAETYNGLGKGAWEEPQVAKTYFAKAAVSYKKIIDRAESEGEKFLEKKRVLLVKLRLVNCWREDGQFQKGFELAQEIVKAMPKNLETQTETARLLQTWGTKKDADKLLMAIHGNTRNKKPGQIWGWGYIAQRLQMALSNMSPTSERAKEYEEKWIDASYQSVLCRFEYAKSLKDQKKSNKQMDAALSEVRGFVSIAGELETDHWNKFAKIYKDVQREKGVSPVLALERPKQYKIATNPNPMRLGSSLITKKKNKKKKAKVPLPPTNWTLVIAALATTVVLAGGLIFMMIKASKNSSVRPTYADDAPDLVAVEKSRKQAALKRENTRKRASAALKKRSSSATATKRRPAQTEKPKRRRTEESE